MELRVLKYFLVVAQEGNITTAAARLHIGQPTLSRQLKELERELGQKLFARQAHGIRLTGEGQLLRQYAQEMTELSDKIDHDFAALRDRPLGDVYLGGIDASLQSGTNFLAHLHAERPDLVFHYQSCCSTDALSMLDRGLIDFAIVSQQARTTRYETLPITKVCRWVACMRPDNPLAEKDALTVEDLADAPLLMYDQALKAPLEINNLALWFGGDFSQLNIVATSNLSEALSCFAHEGMGILLTWESFARSRGQDLIFVPLEPTVTTWATLAWRKDRPLSPAASHLLEAIRATFGGFGAD